jgi:hypothetical protein
MFALHICLVFTVDCSTYIEISKLKYCDIAFRIILRVSLLISKKDPKFYSYVEYKNSRSGKQLYIDSRMHDRDND